MFFKMASVASNFLKIFCVPRMCWIIAFVLVLTIADGADNRQRRIDDLQSNWQNFEAKKLTSGTKNNTSHEEFIGSGKKVSNSNVRKQVTVHNDQQFSRNPFHDTESSSNEQYDRSQELAKSSRITTEVTRHRYKLNSRSDRKKKTSSKGRNLGKHSNDNAGLASILSVTDSRNDQFESSRHQSQYEKFGPRITSGSHSGDPQFHAFHKHLYVNEPAVRKSGTPTFEELRPQNKFRISPPGTTKVPGGSHSGNPKYHSFHKHLYDLGAGKPFKVPTARPKVFPKPVPAPKTLFPNSKGVIPSHKPTRRSHGSHAGDPRYHAFHKHLYDSGSRIPKVPRPTPKNVTPFPTQRPVVTARPLITPTPKKASGGSHAGDPRYHAFHKHLYDLGNQKPKLISKKQPVPKRRPVVKFQQPTRRSFTNFPARRPVTTQRPFIVPQRQKRPGGSHSGDPRYHAFHRHLYDLENRKPTKSPISAPKPTQKPFTLFPSRKPFVTPAPTKKQGGSHSGDPRYHAFHRHLYDLGNPKPTKSPLLKLKPIPVPKPTYKHIQNPTQKPFTPFPSRKPFVTPAPTKKQGGSHSGDPRYHAFHRHLYDLGIPKPTKSPLLKLKPIPVPKPTQKPFIPFPSRKPFVTPAPTKKRGGSHSGDPRYHAFHRHLFDLANQKPTPSPRLKLRPLPVPKPTKKPVIIFPSHKPTTTSRPFIIPASTKRPGGSHSGDPRYHAFHRHLYDLGNPKPTPSSLLKLKPKPTQKPFIPFPSQKPFVTPTKKQGGSHSGDPRYHAFHRHLYDLGNPKPTKSPLLKLKPMPVPKPTQKPFTPFPSRKPFVTPAPTKKQGGSHSGDPRYHAFHRHLYDLGNPKPTKSPLLKLKPIPVPKPTQKPFTPFPSRKPFVTPAPAKKQGGSHSGDPRYHAFHRHLYDLANQTPTPSPRLKLRPIPVPKPTKKPNIIFPSHKPSTTSRPFIIPASTKRPGGSHSGDPRYHAFHRHLYDLANPTPTKSPLLKLNPIPVPKPIRKPFITLPSRKPFITPVPTKSPGGSHSGDPRYHAFHRHLYDLNDEKLTPSPWLNLKPIPIPKPTRKPSIIFPSRKPPITRRPITTSAPTKRPGGSHSGDPRYHAFHRHLYDLANLKPTKSPKLKYNQIPFTKLKQIAPVPKPVPKLVNNFPSRRPVTRMPFKNSLTTKRPVVSHSGDPRYHAFHKHLFDLENPKQNLSPRFQISTPRPKIIPKLTERPIISFPTHKPVTNRLPHLSTKRPGGSHSGDPRYHAFHKHLYESGIKEPQISRDLFFHDAQKQNPKPVGVPKQSLTHMFDNPLLSNDKKSEDLTHKWPKITPRSGPKNQFRFASTHSAPIISAHK